MSEHSSAREAVADELAENGMNTVADVLRERGIEEALAEVHAEIADLRQYPDSDQLTGNLEVAEERLTYLRREEEKSMIECVGGCGASDWATDEEMAQANLLCPECQALLSAAQQLRAYFEEPSDATADRILDLIINVGEPD